MKANNKKENLGYLKKIFRRLNADKNMNSKERALWNEFLMRAKPGAIKDLDGLLKGDRELLSALTKNLFDKYTAFVIRDQDALDHIFEKEIEIFL